MEQIQAPDIETCQWIRLAGRPAVKIMMKNGSLYRFGGFAETVNTAQYFPTCRIFTV